MDPPDHDQVVAGVVLGLHGAVDPGQHTGQHGGAGRCRTPPHAHEPVEAGRGEGPRQRLLVLSQDVHAERPRLPQQRPGGRAPGHAEADQRRLTCALQNMRMSCNSTWLLDKETDHGVKVDELAVLLEELLEDAAAKVVVFSQWIGTHELIERRLAARGWDHVLFHGSIPSGERGALVDRFRNDPGCRVFLSTDAGGVGLNLQHAATVVNMDLPWNPAVLEQRIGRVHRLGQRRNVQVVNFISQGTIEEGMLSLLAFKKSLFAGVLDGAAAEVSLNGTRLARFMESVEKATGAMGRPVKESEEDDEDVDLPTLRAAAEPGPAPAAGVPAPDATSGPWDAVVDAGLQFLSRLAEVATLPAGGERPAADRIDGLEIDPRTGRRYLRLPIPDADAVGKLVDALGGLLARANKG